MKPLLFSLVLAAGAASCCLADHISVTVNTATPCTFTATAITEGFSIAIATGSATGGAGAGKITASPIGITKGLDSCSIPLYVDFFKAAAIPTVVITLSTGTGDAAKPELILNLKNVFVSQISDSDSSATAPSEKIMLNYEAITITDPVDNSSVTYDVATNTESD
jgi:type VI protein secretion system component Hcp